jgi:hypothetical protein
MTYEGHVADRCVADKSEKKRKENRDETMYKGENISTPPLAADLERTQTQKRNKKKQREKIWRHGKRMEKERRQLDERENR